MNLPEDINWDGARKRIESFRRSIEEGSFSSEADQAHTLQARAGKLAQKQRSGSHAGALLEIVEFELAGERYAFELLRVREVCLLKDLTPVPCTPPFVLGIINLRGEIRTVIDLKKFFDLPDRGLTGLNRILLIHGAGLHLGIVADVIRGVHSIRLQELQPPLATLTGVRAEYLRGVTGEGLAVLDAVKILSDHRIVVHDSA